jgi:DNA-binding NarL/FixJ family response regulator
VPIVATDPPSDRDGCRVLVIEDDPTLRFALCALFEREAWIEVVHATATGCEGLDALAHGDADVLVTDARLPDIALDTLLDRASSVSPGTRLVVHTGLGPGEVDTGGGPVVAGYVQKGSDPFELVRALRSIYDAQQDSRAGTATSSAP